MMILLKHFLITVALLTAQQQVVEDLSAEAFREKIETLHDAVLIDLRTDAEVSKGIIPGAVQMDFFKKDFENRLNILDKNKTYLIYCASGGRSGETAELMKQKKFRKIYTLKKGMEEWKDKNFEVSNK